MNLCRLTDDQSNQIPIRLIEKLYNNKNSYLIIPGFIISELEIRNFSTKINNQTVVEKLIKIKIIVPLILLYSKFKKKTALDYPLRPLKPIILPPFYPPNIFTQK